MNNNQPRSCKICNKWFPTGKSMGGHMRSHLAKLPLPPKPYLPPPPPPAGILRSPDPPPPSSSPSSTIISDDDSSNPIITTRTRSRRSKRPSSPAPPPPPPPSSPPSTVAESSSEHTLEEELEVALSLLMMSRDQLRDLMLTNNSAAAVEDGGGGDDDGGRFRCEKCNRGFRSYQALGGHRASHSSRPRIEDDDDEDYRIVDEEDDGGEIRVAPPPVEAAEGIVRRRVFRCSICDKEFDSGQALGGHKKVHFGSGGGYETSKKRRLLSIDLNSPAPGGDDDREVISEVYPL
ncbi:Zinc finger protein ZAT9 [Linum perenne]